MAINLGKTLSYPTSTADVAKDLRAVEGLNAVVESLYRRFETEEGTVPWDRDFGYRLIDLLLENSPDPNFVRQRVEAECKKDDRVLTVQATVTWRPRDRELRIAVEGMTGAGPFGFALSVANATLKLLRS